MWLEILHSFYRQINMNNKKQQLFIFNKKFYCDMMLHKVCGHFLLSCKSLSRIGIKNNPCAQLGKDPQTFPPT